MFGQNIRLSASL